ncbi:MULTISPECIES: LptF/LptG family permease [unclassified Meiothermus]|uniref:LptF/LptG family permease n=1 Tax=unclassified Meiothermus TaxID=370471 RepID=UPI000D7C5542|nr:MULTISPECIES: LptF/LptG family permease [unclassified Meiothermus]PZA08760.1 YjgP/YjgQ family permease [Meiothermus sp. Pnk-1]RYM40618.1 YjgP/YjgQ family permease [Meiothermus sp. PNK-Is4]
MTRIDRYLLREVLPPFLFGIFLYIALVAFSNLLARAQWVGGVPVTSLLQWIGLQIPFIFTQTLPLATLLGVLIGYSRLSRENELLVMQAGGISVLRTARWLLLGAAALALFSLYLSERVVPWANQQTAVVWWDQVARGTRGLGWLTGRDLKVGDYLLFFDGYDNARQEIVNVRLQQWKGQSLSVVFANRGRLEGYRLELEDFRLYTLDLAKLPLPDFQSLEEVEKYLPQLVRAQNVSRDPQASLVITLPQNRDQLVANFAGGGFESPYPPSYWWHRLQNPTLTPAEAREAQVNLHSALAVSLANLVILFLALPVAARRASSPAVALGLALGLTIAYYAVLSLGKLMALSGLLPAELGVWGANLLALAVAFWLGKGVYR